MNSFCWRVFIDAFLRKGFFVSRNAPQETREAEGEVEDDDSKETDRLLGDEGGSEDEVTENISIRKRRKEGKTKKQKKPSLLKTLWSGLFGMNFAMAVVCKLLHDALVFVQPQLLR